MNALDPLDPLDPPELMDRQSYSVSHRLRASFYNALVKRSSLQKDLPKRNEKGVSIKGWRNFVRLKIATDDKGLTKVKGLKDG